MTYSEALRWISSQVRLGENPALDRIKKLLNIMGNPQDKLKFVHVGGTNGKGTTCTMVASVLSESGYKTGLFTSPYVIDFRERFQINGEMIAEDELAKITEKVKPIADKMRENGDTLGQFECITAIAFEWFLAQKCDVVVLEVGIGGRFDATNVIKDPLVSVITSISKDHTDMLGDTIEKIAFEKAGIIKENSPVVLYPVQEKEVAELIKNVCNERKSNLIIPNLSKLNILEEDISGSRFAYESAELNIPFAGKHQIYNAITAYEVLTILEEKDFNITLDNIKIGLSKAFIPARMEVLSRNPFFIIDGGHNYGCATALRKVIKELLDKENIVAVFGMMNDKDSKKTLEVLAPLFSKIILTKPADARSMSAKELEVQAKKFCDNLVITENSIDATRLAFDDWGKGKDVVVCGSFYLASEIREIIIKKLKKI